MNREAFMARVFELAAVLGGQLYKLVEKQSELMRAQALEIAKGKLRADFAGEGGQDARTRDPDRAEVPPQVPRHNPRRTSPGHVALAGGRDRDRQAPRARAAPRAGRRPSCRTCGKEGHNARTCGRESTTRAGSDDDSEEESAAAVASPSTQAPPLMSPTCPMPNHHHSVLRIPTVRLPPPGWTAEQDRIEEYADLSMLTTLRKTS